MRVRAGALAWVFAVGMSWLVLPAYADAEKSGVAERAGAKLVRGVVNVATGWAEIVKQPYRIGTQDGWLAGMLRGPIEGLGMVLARTVGGAYEILTFPFPIPPGYQPMVEPNYVWQREEDVSRSGSRVGTAGQRAEPQEVGAEGL